MSQLVINSYAEDVPPNERSASVTCPVCGVECAKNELSRYTVEQAAAHFCPPYRNEERNNKLRKCISRLWKTNECIVFKCGGCGFAFGQPFVGGDEEFYEILHEQRAYPSWRWDYDVAVSEAISKFDGGRVLDVGAGAGVFLRALPGEWQPYALEGSETTRRELEENGIEVFRDLEQAIRLYSGGFQVVTLFQVLEHISEFEKILKGCRDLLAVGGCLVVTVPDAEAMIRQEQLTGCPDMPPNHIGKWTPKSLSLVLDRLGFECQNVKTEPASWKSLKANLHMRVMADATADSSLASRAYRIDQRYLRILALGLLAGPALLRMLPGSSQLLRGGAFGIVAIAK